MNKFNTVKQFDGLLVMCQLICDGELQTESFMTIRDKYRRKMQQAGVDRNGNIRDTVFLHMRHLRDIGAVKDIPGDRFKFYKTERVKCFAQNQI